MPRKESQQVFSLLKSLSYKLQHQQIRDTDQAFSHGSRDYFSATNSRGSGVPVPIPKKVAKYEEKKQYDALDQAVQQRNFQIREMNLLRENREEIEKLKRQVQKLNYDVSQQRRLLDRKMERSEEALQKGDMTLYHGYLELAKLHRTNIDAIQSKICQLKTEIKEIREASQVQRKLIYKKGP